MNKILVLAGVLIAMVSVHAGMLSWQVTDTPPEFQGFSGANLYADGVAINGQAGTSIAMADVTGYESFYVELINSSGEAIARSGTELYADLASNGYIAEGASEVAMATWHPSGYKAVPEPTSALLMMMGVAFLGLKRRKV